MIPPFKMNTARYRLSFTMGGLFLHEAPLIAERYLASRNWSQTRTEVLDKNLLQARTMSTAKRISSELFARLALLNDEELAFLINSTWRERGYLLWVAVCRRYAFIYEFAVEVLREHYLNRRYRITSVDYDAFYNAKALWHPELDEITLSTQKRLRCSLFQLLREADLLSEKGQIKPALLNPLLTQLISRNSPLYLLAFPNTDNEIRRWLS